MNRHQQRVKLMEAIYQYLLIGKDFNEILQELKTQDADINAYFYDVLSNLYEKEEDYVELIRSNLTPDWDYSRLGYIERSILLLAITENKGLNIDKAVTINEAITLAKAYCDEDSYKLINGILDKA